jgi:hypothetical protein
MGSRKTGAFAPAQEIVVLTCDVCERDIGYEDGSRPRAYLSVTRHPNAGALDDQQPTAVICSRECLAAHAEKLTGPIRETAPTQGGRPRSGPRR